MAVSYNTFLLLLFIPSNFVSCLLFPVNILSFADPYDSLATPSNVDQTYFNVGWGGVRSSSLPIALEPDPVTGTLKYSDVNDVDNLPLCRWGQDGANAGRAERKDLQFLGGYTTFVEDGLLVNQTIPPILPWCRKPTDSTCSNAATCMVSSCTDDQITNDGYTRMELKVAAYSSPKCAFHTWWNGLVSLQCNLHDLAFGRTTPFLQGAEPCSPWTDIGFYNGLTGEGLKIAFVRHWSWSPNNKRLYFAVYHTDVTEAINMVNSIFDNTGNPNPLPIEVRLTSNIASVPTGYDPSILNTFTFVYGKGSEYGGVGLDGKSRRRIGSTEMGINTRDYTVFTINWYGEGARLQAGSTYTNRGFYFNSDMGSVKSTADDLVEKTFVDEIGLELWSPRTIDIYQTAGANFVVLAASSAQGQSTTCHDPSAILICSGTSTPQSGHVPFFYMTCGASSTYFGPDPYNFTTPFGARFPGHGDTNNMVRSYVCDGQEISIRPTWKLMGFFNASDLGCSSLSTSTYEETTCDPIPSVSPSKAPSSRTTESLSDLDLMRRRHHRVER